MNISKILNAGISQETPKEIAKKVLLCNRIALLITFGVAVPFVVLSLIHFKEVAYLPMIGASLCMITIAINAAGFYNASRFILGLIPFTLTSVYGAYLTPAGEQPLAPIFAIEIGFSVIPFILFDVKEKGYLIVSGLFIFISASFFTKELNILFEKDLNIDVVTDGYMFYMSIMTGLAVACGSILFMSFNNSKAQQEQQELLKKMDEQNEELKQSEETLKESLKQVEENQTEEKKRNWASEGLAKFGNLLRSNEDSDLLYDKLISGITQYIGANQSGLFLINREDQEDTLIELQACYAYDRKKFLEKTISPGQGLVGQAYYEKDIIYLTEIPSDYVNITSGLGTANPTAVLIVPLIVNDEVEGFFEIASFKAFEPHVIEFLENLGENIASFINVNRINKKTRSLLQETQQQAEEMRAQEEEMRQNMEELQATQEEMHRKEKEYIARIKSLEEELSTSAQKDLV